MKQIKRKCRYVNGIETGILDRRENTGEHVI